MGVLDHSSVVSYSLPVQSFGVEKGGFSSDGKVLWLWSRDSGGVSVYEAPRYKRLGWIDTDEQLLVSSCELVYKGVKLFVLLLNHQLQSTVAVVSQLSGQLVQAVSIPARASCVCEINETVLPGLFNTMTFEHFGGAVCLGCDNGCVLALDLGLDSLQDQFKSTVSSPRGCRRLHIGSPSIINHMNAAAAKNEQLGLDLNCRYTSLLT